MRDPRKKKQRDLQRAARGGHSPSIYRLFDNYFPELKHLEKSREPQEWQAYWNLKCEWVDRVSGIPISWCGPVPSWFRRSLNRKLRAKQRNAFRRAIQEENWDNFVLPKSRRNCRWLWW